MIVRIIHDIQSMNITRIVFLVTLSAYCPLEQLKCRAALKKRNK
jgi:hypothetical protein